MRKFDFLKIRKKWNLADRMQKKSPSENVFAVSEGEALM